MKVTLGSKEIEIKPLTINQYDILQENPNMDEISLLSLITGLEHKDLKDCDLTQIKFVAKFLDGWISQSVLKPKLNLTRYFDDKLYGVVSPSKMTYGEYSDLHVLLSAKPVDYRRVCSILYRPVISGEGEDRVIEKYDYDTCEARRELMGDFPIGDYISGVFFLTKFNQELLETSLSSLEKKKNTNTKNLTTEQKKKN